MCVCVCVCVCVWERESVLPFHCKDYPKPLQQDTVDGWTRERERSVSWWTDMGKRRVQMDQRMECYKTGLWHRTSNPLCYSPNNTALQSYYTHMSSVIPALQQLYFSSACLQNLGFPHNCGVCKNNTITSFPVNVYCNVYNKVCLPK